MLLNSLKLKNIRSYKDEEMIFPEGSIMLSGDIGSGKTTILLAVEFALFGIIRGQLSGGSLLRHGKSEGFVELNFSVEKKNITIRRSLRRNGKNITQDSGYIIIDGTKQDLTPLELKSKILKLIGYPDELVTKSKSLIYRYTVYTPQEEMKQILFEKQDERLDILRRIFDIDKYKRIKENMMLYLKELKTTISALEAKTEDLETKKKELLDYNEKVLKIDKELKVFEKTIFELKKEFEYKDKQLKSFDENIKEFNSLKNQFDIKNNDVKNKKRIISNYEQEINDLKARIESLEKELSDKKDLDAEKLRLEKKSLEEKTASLEENLDKIKDRESTFKAKNSSSDEIIEKISSLDICPVCEQRVDAEYKKQIHVREHKKVSDVNTQLEKLKELKEKRIKEIFELKSNLKNLDSSLRTIEINLLKKKQLSDNNARKSKLEKDQEAAKHEIKTLEEGLIVLEKKLKEQPNILKKQSDAKEALEKVRGELKSEEIKQAELNRERKTLELFSVRIKEEIDKKEESRKQLSRVREAQNWLLKYLLNIIYLMEKQIMLRIHQEFNEYFQEWFNTLIEDENLNVRLDETFTPIIEQNGYETYIENLSGGERTSVALAYRLALNKVINDFISTIKTKDLLILDEPTDGFSGEQLDKIRDVLEKLLIKQIILVSHEPKLESYVEHIIRVHKEEHVSKVIA
ncbi:MAG: SMC family ATPase [Nanoarchaeota archaeon]|nr:SMC family ATPase [Nanoarchaeota archaeon]MBU1269470.1 SMC family ATPase [Nanoarchaeota archaeon]MBU1603730.1 SMC family ATPase [Nanoarchaeota archaeon]MBU2443033.1 SMC family ATPase [Nanoarchaeota archaeon]